MYTHLQDTEAGSCKALPAGHKALVSLPCNSNVASQRWRPAAYHSDLSVGATLQDSRMESAVNPGMCVMLQKTPSGGLQPVVGSCYAHDLVYANANVASQVCASFSCNCNSYCKSAIN